jgi:hypothetical protein
LRLFRDPLTCLAVLTSLRWMKLDLMKTVEWKPTGGNAPPKCKAAEAVQQQA